MDPTSSALTSAAASSGPAWHVDIPGLSQLILAAGSCGLKQIATSGVDIHSIGCMLMIAEYVPASKEFRSTLTQARELQRSDRLWMYKVVEIGTGSNFLADQLLKDRAGENVLALLSATIPVMDEDTCTSLLKTLFENTAASPDNIPGTAQMQAIRSNLAPLARKTGFRERVLRHHYWLWRVLRGTGPPKTGDLYDAIPTSTDITKIIRLLHKIATSTDTYVMIYSGIRGAAWVVTYACSILGLNTSALDESGNPVPISGTYEDAQVIIELGVPENECQLYLAGNSEDLISLGEAPQFQRRGWSIDCYTINFLELQHPGIRSSPTFTRLSYFVALETMSMVSSVAAAFQQQSLVSRPSIRGVTGFTPYTTSVLSILQERSLNILQTLGFRRGKFSDFLFTEGYDCATFFPKGHRSDPIPNLRVLADGHREYDREGQYIEPGGLGYIHEELLQRLRFYLDNPTAFPALSEESTNFKSSFLALDRSLKSEVASTLSYAINFASKLAFSDWNASFGAMSIRSMNRREATHRSDENTFEGPMSEAIELCVDGVKMIDLETRLWSQDWVALNLDGVVVFRQLSRHYSIHDLNGKYLSFRPGQLLYEGVPCAKIRSDRTGISYRAVKARAHQIVQSLRNPGLFPPGSQTRSPSSSARLKSGLSWSYRELCSKLGDTIFVRLEVHLLSNFYLVVDSSIPAPILPEVLVTSPCHHGFSIEGLENGVLNSDILNCCSNMGIRGSVFEGISFGDADLREDVFYQHADQAPFGQWLACHWKPRYDALIILQRDCCLKCLFIRLEKYVRYQKQAFPVCIIAGRTADGKLGDTRTRSRSLSPLPTATTRGNDNTAAITPVADTRSSTILRELNSFFCENRISNKVEQSAFVIQSIGEGSRIIVELRQDVNYDSLIRSWDGLETWLQGRSDLGEVAESIRSSMNTYTIKVNQEKPGQSRTARPRDKLASKRPEYSNVLEGQAAASSHRNPDLQTYQSSPPQTSSRRLSM